MVRFGPNGVMALVRQSCHRYNTRSKQVLRSSKRTGDCCLMKRIRISKTALYLVFIPSAIGIHTWAWWYFGPYSFGAFAVTIAAYMLIRILIAKLLPFVR